MSDSGIPSREAYRVEDGRAEERIGSSGIGPDRSDGMEQEERADQGAHAAENGQTIAPLFSQERAQALVEKWEAIQSGFVDQPRQSVERADALVKETIDVLASSFSDMRGSLEKSWARHGEISTEDLRLTLRSYRSFFNRLLSVG